MIEMYFHFVVKLAVCWYVLYRIWGILFKQKLFGFWGKIPVRPKKNIPEPVITTAKEEDIKEVIGKTTIVYLEDRNWQQKFRHIVKNWNHRILSVKSLIFQTRM
ncbi:MAG: hypothetical protein LUH22_10265 [Bacteroides sp.]|nr:hypothetical protein [Bacteroides sp.]